MEHASKKEIIERLREQIMAMEGFKGADMGTRCSDIGLGLLSSGLPQGQFPIGAVHEFISPTAACATASNGFISGILSALMPAGAYCLWVSTRRSLFPATLRLFGVQPHQIIFVDVKQDKEALWVMEQGLKCEALVAVVAELREVSFAESQRLQLAVEKSRVTGFLHRRRPLRQQTLACVTRWRIRPAPSKVPAGLPGVGHPVWDVQLEKVRNGRPGRWRLAWRKERFVDLSEDVKISEDIGGMERYG